MSLDIPLIWQSLMDLFRHMICSPVNRASYLRAIITLNALALMEQLRFSITLILRFLTWMFPKSRANS